MQANPGMRLHLILEKYYIWKDPLFTSPDTGPTWPLCAVTSCLHTNISPALLIAFLCIFHSFPATLDSCVTLCMVNLEIRLVTNPAGDATSLKNGLEVVPSTCYCSLVWSYWNICARTVWNLVFCKFNHGCNLYAQGRLVFFDVTNITSTFASILQLVR